MIGTLAFVVRRLQAASFSAAMRSKCHSMHSHRRLHGSCVSKHENAVLLVGPPGSGKSDLVLRLLARGFELVADDQVDLVDGIAVLSGRPGRLAGSPRTWRCPTALSSRGATRIDRRSGHAVRPHADAATAPGIWACRWSASIPRRLPRRSGSPWRWTARRAWFARSPGLSPHERVSGRKSIVLVTGLSGGGKASILSAMEDVGYETVDNPPLQMLEEMVADGDRRLAVGVDARTRGFDADRRAGTSSSGCGGTRPCGCSWSIAWADDGTLLRRYTEIPPAASAWRRRDAWPTASSPNGR